MIIYIYIYIYIYLLSQLGVPQGKWVFSITISLVDSTAWLISFCLFKGEHDVCQSKTIVISRQFDFDIMPSFNQFLNYLLRLCLMCCINIFCMLSSQTCQVKLFSRTLPHWGRNSEVKQRWSCRRPASQCWLVVQSRVGWMMGWP